MLGRRQIREKVVESVYAQIQNPINTNVLEKNMFAGIEKIYQLYIYEINFLIALKDLANQQIEINKNKFLKTEKDLNPNLKFVNNAVIKLLEDNTERRNYSSKHANLLWEMHEEILVKTFQRILIGKRYEDYMNEKSQTFADDQKFIGKLFLRYVAENEDLHDFLEEKELGWADGFHIANTMLQKTIGFLKENSNSNSLIKIFKDDEDRNFAKKLLLDTVTYWEQNEKKLGNILENWDIDRVSLMDKILMVTAIAELDNFPLTPSRVIMNEYLEIAKIFSTEKSFVFINGILDKYTKTINRI